MMAANRWVHPVCHAIVRWQESGENPVVFCYLIVWGFWVTLRSPKLANLTERLEPACWNPSAIYCTPSMMSKG
jgi:hypothetical protein